MADRNLEAAIAVTRFGLGGRPGEIQTVASDPRGWLRQQIRPMGADQPGGPFAPAAERLALFYAYREQRRDARETASAGPKEGMTATPSAMMAEASPSDGADVKLGRAELADHVANEFLARGRLGATTTAGFRERWALFWANHFTVSGVKLIVSTVAGAFEREAIRPHVFGRFSDLLIAASRHPAMLIYLDQAQSAGPNSLAGRRRAAGLNENLAREILELHTVGPDAGYTQADVTEFARALTGWTVGGGRRVGGAEGESLFRAAMHEPGPRTIMARRYPEGGEAQMLAVLRDLAAHPKTASRLARKIAAHFVADQPPPALVARLERAWASSGGDLSAVAAALIEAPEAWTPQAAKLKTPYEFVISAYRAGGLVPQNARQLQPTLLSLGQKPYSPPSPKGWPDEAAAWAAPDAMIKRLQFAEAFAARVAPASPPVETARAVLGSRLSPASEQAIRRAESRAEAFSLLLMSPEFQRR